VIKVGIYDGDVLKWQETFSKTFSKGVFSEVVGKQTAITTGNINLTNAKFGFVIDNGPVQFVLVTAVPYALQARFAETAENIPTTTATVLGGIKVGTGLAMDGNGVLSVPFSSLDVSVVTSNYFRNVGVNGTVSATRFEGDGSLLTNIAASAPPDNSVTSAKIVNGTIVDSDISGSAAIAFSKLSIVKSDITGLGIPGSAADLMYTAGTGLTLNSATFSIASTVVTSNYGGGVTINGTVAANYFVGDGSLLTNINAGAPADNSVTSVAIVNGTITSADIS
jgi:hypothetical protein